MSRPNLVRADTLDLQNPDAPSAQDHKQQPAHPAPLGQGPPAPHQNASLRHAQEERAAEQDYLADQWGSGRSSHEGSELLEEDPDIFSDPGNAHADEHGMHQVGRSSEDSDMTDADEDTGDDDMVDKISSSPSIDDEDIDFEFVYALHTFVATVEGQANASKGDTMQLLDDSNSYWWLVRVMKDSSIGDNDPKPKNMFKQAIKRRNAKMVQFTTPTYYDPAEIDWSDEEEGNSGDFDLGVRENLQSHQSEEHKPATAHERAVLAQQQEENAAQIAVQNAAPNATPALADMNLASDAERPSDDSDANSRRSRNGTLRNTDSFFKDETAEPKKLSLTPSLLRDGDQSSLTSPRSSDSKDKIASPVSDVFDNIDKTSPTSDKFKEEKKKKKEKSGMLSGLFKRKEKKIKVDEAAGGTVRTSQSDLEGLIASAASSSPTESSITSPKEVSPQTSRRPSHSGGKLTKAPPTSAQPAISSNNITSAPTSGLSSPSNGLARAPQPTNAPPTSDPASTVRSVTEQPSNQSGRQPLRIQTPGNPAHVNQQMTAETPPREEQDSRDGGIFSPLSGLIRDPNEPKKEKLKKAKQRIELDVDSSPEPAETSTSHTQGPASGQPPSLAPGAPRQDMSNREAISPIDSRVERYEPIHDQTKHMHSDSPVSPSTPTESTQSLHTPETTSDEPKLSTAATSTTPDSKARTESESEPEWNDASLHRYLEHDQANDVRELLLRVYDTNDVKPVSNDHPIMKQYNFDQHQKRLDEMSSQLDGLLTDFLARKAAKRKNPAAVAATA
ncbi:MAG: hypothetical protein Q9159_001136 [Coniocarpon cinnabarinum]